MDVSPFRALLAAGLLAACAQAPGFAGAERSPASSTSSLPARRVVPLTTVTFSGHRYVARADFGRGVEVPLMIHGNSRMFLSLTHRAGEALNGRPIAKVEEYGYSSSGKGILHVARMRLGGERFTRIPPVPVFDFTEEGDTIVQGMVGVPFLVSARAAVDFSGDLLLLGVARSAQPDRALLAGGYRCVPISIASGERVTLAVRFPVLGRLVRLTPSTVSTALTLHAPLFAGKIPMTRMATPDRSPKGTTPDEYSTERIDFEIDGVPMHGPATFEDIAEYGRVPEGELESFGYLGYDWMKEHRAILDYANRRLYFISAAPSSG